MHVKYARHCTGWTKRRRVTDFFAGLATHVLNNITIKFA